MITAERHARGEIRQTAAAYFAGMVGKAKQSGRSSKGRRAYEVSDRACDVGIVINCYPAATRECGR
jgi:hypothetical protein